jgi:soluble lytic murein transglycosylase-like protein
MNLFQGLAAVLLLQSQPSDPLAPQPDSSEPSEATPVQTVPQAPPAPVVAVPRDWRGVFDAIRAGQWTAAQAGIAALPPSPLTPVAKAELYTAKGSPRAALDPLLDLLVEAPDLPKADQIQRLAEARGLIDTPRIAPRYPLLPLAASPRRGRPRPVTGDVEADRLRTDLEVAVKADDAGTAELLMTDRLPLLTPEARLEAAHRVAWIYYVRGDDGNARRVADTARIGAAGEWAAHLAWVSGLAAWRQNDCQAAAPLFRQVGTGVYDQSTQAAGWYWAARAEMACRRPEAVNGLLRNAARLSETFYGMVARRTLGIDPKIAPMPAVATARVEQLPNVRRAAELMKIGERDLAGQFLRFQARVGNPADHLALVQLASRWELSATQHYLAHFGRQGVQLPAAARYPQPSWSPRQGWRIDPALGLAHALQESSFRAEAVSPAGAVGLMQVLPGTMNLLARNGGIPAGDLRDPATNMEFGQRWIELMRTNPYTQGQLPKIIASYNAGPQPVGRWQVNDRGDPLLWMESIPYWETRFYVPIVLRNMWVYQGFAGSSLPTLTQVAQHKWPTFPAARGR